jgi:hypothetical protein
MVGREKRKVRQNGAAPRSWPTISWISSRTIYAQRATLAGGVPMAWRLMGQATNLLPSHRHFVGCLDANPNLTAATFQDDNLDVIVDNNSLTDLATEN